MSKLPQKSPLDGAAAQRIADAEQRLGCSLPNDPELAAWLDAA